MIATHETHNTLDAVQGWLNARGHAVAPVVSVTEPFGSRPRFDGSETITVDIEGDHAGDHAVLKIGKRTWQLDPSPRIVARTILAAVFEDGYGAGEHAADRGDWALVEKAQLRRVPVRFTVDQLKTWAKEQP